MIQTLVSSLVLSTLASASVAAQETALPSREIGEDLGEIHLLSADAKGRYLALATKEGTLQVWDLKKEKLLWSESKEIPYAVIDIGKEVLSATVGAVATADSFELLSGEKCGSSMAPAKISRCTAIVCDTKDRWIWMGLESGVVTRTLIDSAEGWSRRALGNGGVLCMAQDAKGKVMAVGGSDHSLRFVNPSSASVDDKKVFEGHASPITAVDLDAGGKKCVSGDESGTIRVWTVSSGKLLAEIKAHEGPVRGLQVHPKGKKFVSFGEDNAILLWGIAKGEALATVQAAGDGSTSAVAWVENGDSLATAGHGPRPRLWDLSDL